MEVLILLMFGIIMYFIPTIIASSRKHNNTIAIFLTNLLLGWIGIGWIIALIWSTTNNTK